MVSLGRKPRAINEWYEWGTNTGRIGGDSQMSLCSLLRVVGPAEQRPRTIGSGTVPVRCFRLDPTERLVMTVLAQRHLLRCPDPQPLTAREAATELATLQPGQAWQPTLAILTALTLRGHTVDVFSDCPPVDGANYGHRYIKMTGSLRTFRFAWRLRREDFSSYDVLHAHGDDYWLWRRRASRHIRTVHGAGYKFMK